MSICDLSVLANNIGQSCDDVADIKNLLQDLLDTLCNAGLCSPTPQEVAIVEECVDRTTDFDAYFGDCPKEQRMVVSKCPTGDSVWVTVDDGAGGTTWTKILTPRMGYDSGYYFRTIDFQTGSGFSHVKTYTIPVEVGRSYRISFHLGYNIEVFGNVNGPIDTVYFSIYSANTPYMQPGSTSSFPTAPGMVLPYYRDGARDTFHYSFIATQPTETLSIYVQANGTGSGWRWHFYTTMLEYTEL